MAQWMDRLDGFLGRMVFRFFGILCAIVAMVCAYAAWWHVENPIANHNWVPVLLFSVAALASSSCVPHCFARKRRFIEALDAMEGGIGDKHRRR